MCDHTHKSRQKQSNKDFRLLKLNLIKFKTKTKHFKNREFFFLTFCNYHLVSFTHMEGRCKLCDKLYTLLLIIILFS